MSLGPTVFAPPPSALGTTAIEPAQPDPEPPEHVRLQSSVNAIDALCLAALCATVIDPGAIEALRLRQVQGGGLPAIVNGNCSVPVDVATVSVPAVGIGEPPQVK